MKMEQCSETSAYKIQTPGNYPEESIQHSLCSELHFCKKVKVKGKVYFITGHKSAEGSRGITPLFP